MTPEERNALIETYGQGFADLAACLAETPKEMWQYKPAPTEWSVHEIIVHLADSESNSALRARMLVAEPGNPIMAYDQDAWANVLNYHQQSWEDALEVVKWARKTTYEMIKRLPEEVWQHSVIHPELDEPFGFERWLQIYAGHIPGHIDQINNNKKLWQAEQE